MKTAVDLTRYRSCRPLLTRSTAAMARHKCRGGPWLPTTPRTEEIHETRQYFPKGTDLSLHGPEELEAVAATLNGRPRKTLGWRTPAEALDELLTAAQTAGVATTG